MTLVLVAEDDIHIRYLIQKKLELSGYKVLLCANGKDALNLTLTEHPRLILLDVMMPEMNGLEVCRSVKAQLGTRAPKIIIISARGEEEDVIAAETAGADDYLIKPFPPADLTEHIKRLLGQ